MVAVDPGTLSLVGFSFTLGAATFFAPCAYPLLPGYVAYYLGQSEDATPRGRRTVHAVAVGTLVSAGFFLVYGVLAGLVVLVGTQALSQVSVLELVVGALLIVLGAVMAAGWSPTLHVQLPNRRRSFLGFFSFGVVYAAAAAGCTAPIFIAVALKALSSGPVASALIFAAYAAGMSVLMITVTALSAMGRGVILRRLSRNTGRVRRVAGVLLVVAGVVQIYLFLFEFEGLELLGLA